MQPSVCTFRYLPCLLSYLSNPHCLAHVQHIRLISLTLQLFPETSSEISKCPIIMEDDKELISTPAAEAIRIAFTGISDD